MPPVLIEREFRPPEEPVSTGQPTPNALLLPGAPEGASEIRFVLNDLVFEGAAPSLGADPQSFAGDMIGREVSLADIYEIAAKITRVYAERGYLLSIAIVPAQDIENGRAVIKILEGYVSEIEIAGDPGPARDLLAAHGRNLMAMRPLTRPALERYLLLAGDLPGLDVSGVFERSTAGDGGVKLVLDAARKTLDASLDINNRGSRAIGRERAVVFPNASNPDLRIYVRAASFPHWNPAKFSGGVPAG